MMLQTDHHAFVTTKLLLLMDSAPGTRCVTIELLVPAPTEAATWSTCVSSQLVMPRTRTVSTARKVERGQETHQQRGQL